MTSSSLTAVPADEPIYLTLTPMQIDVLGHLLTDGAANDMIARRLHRQLDTVKTHMRRIFEKANIASRVELVVKVLREEIVVLDDKGRRVRF